MTRLLPTLLTGVICALPVVATHADDTKAERSLTRSLSKMRGKASWRKGHARRVDLRLNERADEALELVGRFPHLEGLNLAGSAATDQGVAHLSQLQHLVALDLSGTAITDDGLEHLSGMHSLRSLSLFGTNVSDAGLAHLEHLRELQSLDLGRTKVVGAGLSHLRQITGLAELNLGYTPFGNAGLPELHQFRQLRSVVLDGTAVTDSGIESLRTHDNLFHLRIRAAETAVRWGERFLEMERAQREFGPDPNYDAIIQLGGGRLGKQGQDKIAFIGPHERTPADACLAMNTDDYAVLFEGVPPIHHLTSCGGAIEFLMSQNGWRWTDTKNYLTIPVPRRGHSGFSVVDIDLLRVKRHHRFEVLEVYKKGDGVSSQTRSRAAGPAAAARLDVLVFDGKQKFDMTRGKLYLAVSLQGTAREL